MGLDKGSILLGNRPLVQIAADLLAGICLQVFVLAPAGRYAFLNLPHVPDRFADGGPLVGLISGLESSDTNLNLFLPCDMPFLTQEIMLRILEHAAGTDAAVPQDRMGRWFPLSAAYRRSCIPAIEESLQDGNRRADSFFNRVVVRPVLTQDYPESLFANIHSPADLAQVCGSGETPSS
ncbi:MAG: molybdenum cofactor guanylyltransferase [Acidobacteria bacterium]|nr:molybdenum cofactor guanylyltransferase [Acidobacteriota bacterium]